MHAPHSPKTSEPEAVFFIVGAGRCGSTLLQSMLMSHPDVAVPPETHFFFRFDPALRYEDPLDPKNDEDYARSVAQMDWARQLGLIEESLCAQLASGNRSAKGLFLWLCREHLGASGTRVLGEKSPRHERCIDRIRELFPAAKIIHMVRDPRDVVLSSRKEHWAKDQSVLRFARSVKRTLERLRRTEAELGPGVMARVRYEDLVLDPEPTLRELCGFLDLAFDGAMLRFYEREDAGYLSSEEGWKERTRSPLDPSRVARYRADMPMRDVRSVERAIGSELLESYGYARAEGQPDALPWKLADALEPLGWWLARQKKSITKRLGAGGT